MKRGTVLTGSFLFFLGALLVLSCQSVQKDLLVSGMDESGRINIAELEETIVRLESAPAENTLAGARRRIGEMEKQAVPDAEFQALLAAWSGRLSILEGRSADAQRELKRSQTLSPGNWPSVVLQARLEKDRQKRLGIIHEALAKEELGLAKNAGDHEGPGELGIEEGRILLELNRYAEAVAAFDLAFILLEKKPFYRETSRAGRDRAWELRNLEAGSKTVEIVQREGITWNDLIEITKSETDFLRFITAGRDWPVDEIFNRLLERSFVPATQDITLIEWPATVPGSDETVLRSGAAWFLWHIHAENRANRGLLSRYSSRYANSLNARSPIGDLPLLSPFFDSILGCVESEFMSLSDGKNFFPDEKVRGSAYFGMLKKMAP
ncbi:MAG: hypothetical protein LBS48_01850 [Treponema sp.]|jgi:tetratricopeptide (TPR) repeat protein|nr:hypothetical protein [Treponema sp.]